MFGAEKCNPKGYDFETTLLSPQRSSWDCHISIMGFPILERWHIYIKMSLILLVFWKNFK